MASLEYVFIPIDILENSVLKITIKKRVGVPSINFKK